MNLSSICPRNLLRFTTYAVLLVALLASRAMYAQTTYTVTDTSDNASDTGSLRYAVNTAVDGDTIDFASNVRGTITLTSGTLAVNTAVTIAGPGANLLIISGNNAAPVFTIGTAGTVNFSGLTITNGNNATLNGGGISHSYAGTWAVNNCAFIDNTSVIGGGGGIDNGGTLTLENSTFVGNSALAGGGLSNNGGTATIENTTFIDNSSTGGGPGGAIFNNGAIIVLNSTITGNSVDGIWNNGANAVTLTNSIVSGNANGFDCENCGTQSANNLVGGAANLGPLQYNGGTTETMMPLPGSAAIGAGSSSNVSTDQRGFARSTSGASDLGAVSTNYLTVTTTADSTDTTTCTGGATCSLRDAITAANSNGSGDVVFQSGVTGAISPLDPLPGISGNLTISGIGMTPLKFSEIGPFPFGISVQSGANVALSGLTVANANLGGPFPMIALLFNGGGTLAVNGCTFSGNDVQMAEGVINNNGTLMVTNSTFSGNTTSEGAIFNDTVTNSTFSGNTAFEGGAIYNEGPLLVADSTISGNTALNAGYGGGIYNNSGTLLMVTNSIVAGNTGGASPGAPDDCANCGTQSPSNMIGGSPELGALASNGLNATVQTMLPLPGSPAIQAGDPTLLPVGLTMDERGFARLTGGKLDLGAAQTNYTSIQFVQQPLGAVLNAAFAPAVTAEVLETNSNLPGPNNTDAVNGIPLTLTFNGTGTLGGTLTQTTSGGVASFGDLNVNTVSTGDALATALMITSAQTLTATSSAFDITLVPSTVNFNPPLPAGVTYGVAPLTLKANAESSGTLTGQSVTFQVDSGPATVNGNVLTITGAGTVVVEVDAAANNTYGASDVTASITVAKAASALSLTASANQAPPGAAVVLTATATSTAGVPTGTVIFLTAAGPLGTAALTAQGVAMLSVTTLPSGSNAITASYSGDGNFTGSGAQLSAPVVIVTPTFTLTAAPASLTLRQGQIGTATFTVTPQNGYNGTVNLSCTSLPAYATCSFNPASVTLDGSGKAVTAQLTIITQGPVIGIVSENRGDAPLHPASTPAMAAIFWLPGLLLAGFLGLERKRLGRAKRQLLLLALMVGLAGTIGSLSGCGGPSSSGVSSTPPNTPTGSYTVTVTGSPAQGSAKNTAFALTVTQ